MYNCIICNSSKYEKLLILPTAIFDNSLLYSTIKIICCERCGHIYNLLTNKEKEKLIDYYKYEYAKVNMSSPNKTGDIPGSTNKNSLHRYSLLYNFIKPYLKQSDSILDIGCATGGFLKYLKQKGNTKLYGIDFSNDYLNVASQNKDLIIKNGFVENIPDFKTKFNFIIADQIVEHLIDPNKIFTEAKKILKKDGYLCISIPNALEYNNNYFFDFYWFLLKEHIHHFDKFHLCSLADKHGFYMIACMQETTKMTSERTTLPILSIIFKYSKRVKYQSIENFNLKENLKKYIIRSYKGYFKKQDILYLIKFSNIDTLYIYGMSREFLFLYKNTVLKLYNLILIDDTSYRQNFTTLNKNKIYDSSILRNIKELIIISAVAHTKLLKRKLKKLNFKGKIISF